MAIRLAKQKHEKGGFYKFITGKNQESYDIYRQECRQAEIRWQQTKELLEKEHDEIVSEAKKELEKI